MNQINYLERWVKAMHEGAGDIMYGDPMCRQSEIISDVQSNAAK